MQPFEVRPLLNKLGIGTDPKRDRHTYIQDRDTLILSEVYILLTCETTVFLVSFHFLEICQEVVISRI